MARFSRSHSRFTDNPDFVGVERRLEEWANWFHVYRKSVGWAIPNSPERLDPKSRSNTTHSDPTWAYVFALCRPDGFSRELETDSVIMELPAIWRKLLVLGYIENLQSFTVIAERSSMNRKFVAESFQAIYGELLERFVQRRTARIGRAA